MERVSPAILQAPYMNLGQVTWPYRHMPYKYLAILALCC